MSEVPYFDMKFPVGAEQFKIGAVRRNQQGAVRPRGERAEQVEMQVSELVRHEAFLRVNFFQ